MTGAQSGFEAGLIGFATAAIGGLITASYSRFQAKKQAETALKTAAVQSDTTLKTTELTVEEQRAARRAKENDTLIDHLSGQLERAIARLEALDKKLAEEVCSRIIAEQIAADARRLLFQTEAEMSKLRSTVSTTELSRRLSEEGLAEPSIFPEN